MIERGRYQKLDRGERKCNVCKSGEIGDEIHFVLICGYYKNIREEYLQGCIKEAERLYGNQRKPEIFVHVMKNCDPNKLATFCWKASQM